MNVSEGLIVGSHNRNELVIIRCSNGQTSREPAHGSSHETCRICGDEVGATEAFVGCNECAFPICKPCYEYERREGSQLCPQCKTRFGRLKGCVRVPGDDDDDDNEDDDVDGNLSDIQQREQEDGTCVNEEGRKDCDLANEAESSDCPL